MAYISVGFSSEKIVLTTESIRSRGDEKELKVKCYSGDFEVSRHSLTEVTNGYNVPRHSSMSQV